MRKWMQRVPYKTAKTAQIEGIIIFGSNRLSQFNGESCVAKWSSYVINNHETCSGSWNSFASLFNFYERTLVIEWIKSALFAIFGTLIAMNGGQVRGWLFAKAYKSRAIKKADLSWSRTQSMEQGRWKDKGVASWFFVRIIQHRLPSLQSLL